MKKKFLSISVMLILLAVQNIFSQEGAVCVYEPNRMDGKTSSGIPFKSNSLTCAHGSLPFGTNVSFSHNGKTVSGVIVTDRINAQENIFFVTEGVMSQLYDGPVGVLDVDYVINVVGSGQVAWQDKGSSWYVAANIKCDNISKLYNGLLNLGYKPRYMANDNTLAVPYIVDHRWNMFIGDLTSFGVDVSQVAKYEMELSPMRL